MSDVAPVVPDSAILAYVHDAEVAYSWHQSVVELIGYDLGNRRRIINGGFLAVRYGTGGIVDARNEVAGRFLSSDAEWLFWVDTDMGFAPDTVDRLIAAADPVERPVVGALCFAQRETQVDGMGGFRCEPVPTLYRWAQIDDGRYGFTPWFDYPRDEVVPVAATGSACIVVHRSAMQAVVDETGPAPYSRMANPTTGQMIGEDLAFCARLGSVGIPVHVDTSVRTTHLKRLWLAEGDYDAHVRAFAPAG